MKALCSSLIFYFTESLKHFVVSDAIKNDAIGGKTAIAPTLKSESHSFAVTQGFSTLNLRKHVLNH